MAERSWVPAERTVPDLLPELMLMGTVEVNGTVIQQYKHRDTRRYLNLNGTGQAWDVMVDDSETVRTARITRDTALAQLLT